MKVRAAAIVLLLGCGSDDSSSETRFELETRGCDVAAAARFYFDATQVTYDFQPLEAPALVARSTLVVRGQLRALTDATLFDHAATRLTVEVDTVYKGDVQPGDQVQVDLGRSEAITAADLATLATKAPPEALTLFLMEYGESYSVTTPQALIVAGPCGLRQPLADPLIFPATVDTDLELDAALRAP